MSCIDQRCQSRYGKFVKKRSVNTGDKDVLDCLSLITNRASRMVGQPTLGEAISHPTPIIDG
jgi:hypothetical protein